MADSSSSHPRRPEDRELALLYRRIALILRGGFLLALSLMLAGVAIAVVRSQEFGGEVIPLRDMPAALRRFDAQAILDFGFLTLLATPLAFVVVALVTFARQRDWLFFGVCGTLIVILLGGVALALL